MKVTAVTAVITTLVLSNIVDSKPLFTFDINEFLNKDKPKTTPKYYKTDKYTLEDKFKIVSVTEKYIKENNKIGYGGTAINNILPKEDRFYNYNEEMPDYDFFSSNPKQEAMNLVNLYHSIGYNTAFTHTSTFHESTFKVFVGSLGVADISYVPPGFIKILEEAPEEDENGFKFSSTNYLRLALYKELSRPQGNTKRWEKLFHRLKVLNRNHGLYFNNDKTIDGNALCAAFEQEQKQEQEQLPQAHFKVMEITKQVLVEEEGLFFSKVARNNKNASFDYSISNDVFEVALLYHVQAFEKLQAQLMKIDGVKSVTMFLKNDAENMEEIPAMNEIQVTYNDNTIRTIAYFYEPIGCLSYETQHSTDMGKPVRIATVNTMLNNYFASTFIEDIHFNEKQRKRVFCNSLPLMSIQESEQSRIEELTIGDNLQCSGFEGESFSFLMAKKSAYYQKLKAVERKKLLKAGTMNEVPTDLVLLKTKTSELEVQDFGDFDSDMFFCYSPKHEPLEYCKQKLDYSFIRIKNASSIVVTAVFISFLFALFTQFMFRKNLTPIFPATEK
eukprot:Pgem_evm1s15801